MKMKFVLSLAGVVLFGVTLGMAGNVLPGMGLGGNSFVPPQQSSCVGDFGGGTGVCNIFEEPDNAEVQSFDLGSPNIGTGLVSIFDADGVTLSDSLDFEVGPNGNVWAFFASDGSALAGGAPAFEDAAGNWCYLCGFGNNVYQGVSPDENGVPEPSSLLLLGSGVVGLAGVVRRRLL